MRTDAGDGALGRIVDTGTRLVTTVPVTTGEYTVRAMFESDDGGRTWSRSQDAGPVPDRMELADGTLVGAGAFDVESSDGNIPDLVINRGGAWEPLDVVAAVGPSSFLYSDLIADGAGGDLRDEFQPNRWSTATRPGTAARGAPRRCSYAVTDRSQRSTPPTSRRRTKT